MDAIKKIKEKPIYEYLFVGILLILASIIFASKTGILNAGYHFTDDHEIFDILNRINRNGFFNTLSFFVIDDLSWRYRPLFFIVRVIRTFIIKDNFFLWHLIVAIECGCYMAFSYILARKMRIKIIPSLFFSFIFLIGSQNEIVWRMGSQENMGLFFLSLSFLLAYWYFEKDSKIYGVLASISIILMGLCKESFLLLIPAVILFLFYLYVSNSNEKESVFKKALLFIKKYKWFILSTCVSLVFGIAVIFLYVGLMEPGYAGIDTSYTVYEYIRLMINIFIRDLKDYLIVFGLIILITIVSIIDKRNKNELNKVYWQKLLIGFIFFAYAMAIQSFLHAKSGMFDRYKLPLLWVLFFSIIVLLKEYINEWLHYVIVVGICVFAIVKANINDYNIINSGKYYGIEGNRTTSMLNEINSLNTNNDLVVLTDFYWYELDLSSSIYLQVKNGIENVFYLDDDVEDGEYYKIYNENSDRISKEDADIILTDTMNVDKYNLDDYIVSDYVTFYILKIK